MNASVTPTDRLKCVSSLGESALVGDEVVDIRVRRVEHRHTRAAATTAHRDDTRGGVIQPKERHRSAGRAARAGHSISGGSQVAERISGAAAGALNLGGLSEGREDRVQRILNGQHETAGEQPEVGAGVHQRGRIRQEFEVAQ